MSDKFAINDQATDPLNEFIAAFNLYEAETGVFALRDEHGVPWWDLVRYRVQFVLCVERDIYGRSSAPTSPKLVRAKSIARQAQRLMRDMIQLCRRDIRHARTLVVSRRSLDYIEGVTAREAERGEGVFFVNKSGNARAPDMAVTSQSIQFFIRLALRAQHLPPEVAQEARRLADNIRKRFDSEADIFGVIAKKYREELVARRAWSFILGRAGAVERVLYANDDMLKSLVVLARAHGIDTEEVQHAYMGRAHIGFSYPPLNGALEALPDRAIVTRDTGDITYPVEHVFVKTEAKQRIPVPRTIDVLIGSSPSRRQETEKVVAALVGQGLRVALKLHPSETKESSAIAAQYSAEEVVVYAGEENFCDLVWQAHVFVPVNATSTTAFEAAEMNARVVLVDIGGAKKTALTDEVASARAGSLQALPQVVRSQLDAIEVETELVAGNEQ